MPSCAIAHRALVADPDRNAQIVRDLTAALGRGRNCLVLTRRVAHIDILTTMLAERGHHALVLQGGMPTADRKAAVHRLADAKAGDGVLVIGTTPFIGEGFDAPALDTLFLAAPISFDGLLVQCAGRVIRSAPGKDSSAPPRARTPPKCATTTTPPRRSSPYHCNAVCRATAPSASALERLGGRVTP